MDLQQSQRRGSTTAVMQCLLRDHQMGNPHNHPQQKPWEPSWSQHLPDVEEAEFAPPQVCCHIEVYEQRVRHKKNILPSFESQVLVPHDKSLHYDPLYQPEPWQQEMESCTLREICKRKEPLSQLHLTPRRRE